MKKLLFVLTFVLMSTMGFSQNGGGIFQRGQEVKENNRGGIPGLP